ncbi:MAG TPA: DUF2804 domain-containing protein [Candidatus Binatia bacterium]|nr:DUF2804 domain-containing protein [Candidatus Binatia bacterium]
MTSSLPDFMPIVADRMRPGDYLRAYDEPELTAAVDLCDARGVLNPAAVGWSRTPLVRANLSGHWPRKKRWNFWNWIGPRFVFSVTLADIDYAAFCQMTFTDFETKQSIGAMARTRSGSIVMPEHVERTVSFRGSTMEYANVNDGGDMKVDFAGTTKSGERVVADFIVRRPRGHESLNIVVPWTRERFQLNSKHNTLPCEGSITVGKARYAMDPAECHAVQDFGRGIWPYRSFWNWGVATGVQNGRLIGVNVGAKWTTGTGMNENGLCVDGRLYKIMEDLVWRYDPSNWMQPWHVRAARSGMVDLTLEPFTAHCPMLNLGIVRSGGVCAFGRWRGTIRFDGQELPVRNLIGWAEEFSHRW